MYLEDVAIVSANSLWPCSRAVIAKSLKYSQRCSKTFPMIASLISALKKCSLPLFAISSHKYTSIIILTGTLFNFLGGTIPSVESPTRIRRSEALFTKIRLFRRGFGYLVRWRVGTSRIIDQT